MHFKPWGLAPFLPMPAAELCDRPVTVEQVWGRPAIAELRDRLATADGPHEMLTLLEEEPTRRLCETAGLRLVCHTSGVIAATTGAVAIGDLSVAAVVRPESAKKKKKKKKKKTANLLQERQPTTLKCGAPKPEESPVSKVVMYASVSVDGFIADENDQPGLVFDRLSNGDVRWTRAAR